MPGRPRTPTRLKVLRGTARPDRTNPSEPKPKRDRPRCPAWLSPTAKTVWRKLAGVLDRMRVLTEADGHALELLADAYGEYRAARAVILKEGTTYESDTKHGKIVRTRPEVAIAADAWKRMKAMLVEFGLTPSSRSQVSAAPVEEEDEMETFLKRQLVR